MTARRAPREQPHQLDSVLDFMRLLWSIEHGLQRVSKRMDATIGITGNQRLALLVVERYPGISARGLADVLHLHPSTMTGVIQRLQRKSLLEREPDALDGRRARLRAAPAARAFTRHRAGTVEAAVTQALAAVPPRQIHAARAALAALAEALNADGESPRRSRSSGARAVVTRTRARSRR
jgi:MarR family transcriptional regulator, organic hydroperoxide resistance regulator